MPTVPARTRRAPTTAPRACLLMREWDKSKLVRWACEVMA